MYKWDRGTSMSTLWEVETRIYEMRQLLHRIINEKGNLLDLEVIIVSQRLDDMINEYNRLLKFNEKE